MNTSSNPVSALCTGCGVCVADSGNLLKMVWDADGFLVPSQVRPGDLTGAKRACPFSKLSSGSDEDDIGAYMFPEAPVLDARLGRVISTYIGFSIAHRETSSSGGLATFCFSQLAERGLIDYVVSVKLVDGQYMYRITAAHEHLVAQSKTRYCPVTLAEVLKEMDALDARFAISGVACFTKAVRMRQMRDPVFSKKVVFIAGIICGGWKSRSFTDYLADSAGDRVYRNAEYRIKDPEGTAVGYSFGMIDSSGSVRSMKMSHVGDMWGTGLFKAEACDSCTDVSTELADISLGDAWLPEYRSQGMGNSVIVTRSALAESLVREGINLGLLAVDEVESDRVVQSQRASFSHRQDASFFRFMVSKLSGRDVALKPRQRHRRLIRPSYMVVQLLRSFVRSQSHRQWKAATGAADFNARMSPSIQILKLATKVYHRLKIV